VEPAADIKTDGSCHSDLNEGAPQHSSAGENEPLTQPELVHEFDQRITWCLVLLTLGGGARSLRLLVSVDVR
jgi:hypothetical protein